MNRFLRNIKKVLCGKNQPPERIVTPYNYLEIAVENGKKLLNSRNTNYSYGGLHKVFQYVFNRIPPDIEKIKKVLILGFGGGSVAAILRDEYGCNCTITGVEIDSDLIELVKKHFDNNVFDNVDIVIADAVEFVKKDNQKYDLIVTDLFIDHKIPHEADSSEFLENLYRLLNTGGKLFFNRLNYDFSSKERNRLFETRFRNLFSDVRVVSIGGFSQNSVFVGGKK